MKVSPITLVKGTWAFFSAVKHPDRLDNILTVSESTAKVEFGLIAQLLRQNPLTQDRLRLRQGTPRFDFEYLDQCPEGSLGKTFMNEFLRKGLTPESFPAIPEEDDPTFIRNQLYQTHDIWHVVTGFPTDTAGEMGLQAFYLAQFENRLAALILAGGFLNAAIYAMNDVTRRMSAVAEGWELGMSTQPFFGFDFTEYWSKPVVEVRRALGVPENGVKFH